MKIILVSIVFHLKVNDTHVDSQIATVSITVNSINDAPLAETLIKNTQINTPVDITLLGSDIENDPLTFSIVGAPTHGSLSGSIPNLTYTPNGGYSGSDSFTTSERYSCGQRFSNSRYQYFIRESGTNRV